MTAKQDDTSKLVQRIIISVASVACVFILSSANARIGRLEDKTDTINDKLKDIQRSQDVATAIFNTKLTTNDRRLNQLESRKTKNQNADDDDS